MNNGNFFTETEWTEFRACYRELVDTTRDAFAADERTQIRKLMQEAIISGVYPHGKKGINLLLRNVHTVLILCEKIGHERNMLLSVLLYPLVAEEYITIEDLIDLPLIVSRQGITEDYPKLFKEKLDQLHIVATFDLIYNASIMVKEGFGYALSFDKIVDTSEKSELCFRVLKPELKTNMYIIWKKYQVFTPIAEKLLSKMQQHFNDR